MNTEKIEANESSEAAVASNGKTNLISGACLTLAAIISVASILCMAF